MAANNDWVAVQDPKTGNTYYANMVTRETRWDKPPGFTGAAQPQVQYNPNASTTSFSQSVTNFSDQSSVYSQSTTSFYGQQQPNGQQSFYGQPQQQQQMMGQGQGQPMQQQQQPQQQGSFYQGQPQQQSFYGQQQQGMGMGMGMAQQQQQQGASQMSLTPQNVANSKWKSVVDPNSGRTYYFHEDTKETRWTLPPELTSGGGSAAAKRLSAQMAVQSGQSELNIHAAWQNESDDDDDENDSWNDNKDDDSDDDDSDDGLETYDANKQGTVMPMNSNVVDDDNLDDSDDEENKANNNPLGDDDEVLVDDTSNKYYSLGTTQAEQYRMQQYGERFFQKDKHSAGLFKKKDVVTLLEYEPYKKVKYAIRKLDSKLNTQAMQTWKNINSYMGNRKSGKPSMGHVEKLIRFALKAPEELRDEIYIQLVKQTTKNPKQDSLYKGWSLLAICCSIFPPSDEFACYLSVYLASRMKEAGKVGSYATFSLQALDRTMEVGQRRIQPLDAEIKRIEEMQPIPIKVYFPDGTFRILMVTSQTRASQVETALAGALRLNHSASFGLFEMENPKPGWEIKVYENRKVMDRQQKIDDLQNMPFDRELEMNERIMDVASSWKRSKKKQNRNIRFVYKCKLHSKAQESSYSRNGWKIAFLSAIWHVVYGYYPIEQKTAIELASLQLQGIHGIQQDNKNFYDKGVIVDKIDEYLPHEYASKLGSDEAENLILERHSQYKHLDKQDAYRKYIEFLRKSEASLYFGNCFFRCVRVSRLKKQKTKEQEDLLLGISENGVIFVDPLKKNNIIERYKMEEILTYGFRSNAFLFVAGTLMTQKKYQFATMLGKQMNDLLRAHIDLRVQQAEAQGYNIQMQ